MKRSTLSQPRQFEADVCRPTDLKRIRVTYIHNRGVLAHDTLYAEYEWIAVASNSTPIDTILQIVSTGFWLDTIRRANPNLRVFIPPSAIIELSEVEK